MLGITNGRWPRTRSAQSVAVVCCRLDYMQKTLAGGGKPVREEAWILQFTHVERRKHLLERGKTKWSTHTTRIPYAVPRVIYHTSVNIRKCIVCDTPSHRKQLFCIFQCFLYRQNRTRTNYSNRVCYNFSSQTVYLCELYAAYHTHLVKLIRFCSLP